MGSHYVVFQYSPDPGTDEKVNFGVAAYGDDGFRARFVRRWQRIQSFGDGDIAFLKAFARRVEVFADARPVLREHGEFAPAALEVAARDWVNSIQVTPPRYSTVPASDLLEDLARQFLREPVAKARARDRRYAANVASEYVQNALNDRGVDDIEHVLRRRINLQGRLETHEFDIVVGNGSPLAGALALSFQAQSQRERTRDLSVTAWNIDDVKQSQPDLDLAVVMLPPRAGTSKSFERAVHVIQGLDARAVRLDEDVADWADSVAALAEHATSL